MASFVAAFKSQITSLNPFSPSYFSLKQDDDQARRTLRAWKDRFLIEQGSYACSLEDRSSCKKMLIGAKQLPLDDVEVLEGVAEHLTEMAKKSEKVKAILLEYLDSKNSLGFKREHRLEISLRLFGLSEKERLEVIQMK